jgi:hypothetical protein
MATPRFEWAAVTTSRGRFGHRTFPVQMAQTHVFSTRRAPPLEEREWEACRRTRSKESKTLLGLRWIW